MKLNIKLESGAKKPQYSSEGAAGLDFFAKSKEVKLINTGRCIEYDTGVRVEIPEGHVGLIFPRSSITTKTTLALGNAVGVIDSDYRGTIKFQFRQTNQFTCVEYNQGDKIGQMIVVPYPKIELNEVDEVSDSNRGEGAFGSTGK